MDSSEKNSFGALMEAVQHYLQIDFADSNLLHIKNTEDKNAYLIEKLNAKSKDKAQNSELDIEAELDEIQEVLFSFSRRDFSKKLEISEYLSTLDALKLTINIQGEELEQLMEELDQKKLIEAQNLEKEILLKEIHHRVKNNLQIITSLLGLQSNMIKSDEVKKIFRTSQHRINSIAMVHELLYQSDNLSKTYLRVYIRKLVESLIISYRGMLSEITFNFECENVSIGMETAISLGLILNEIVTNALKYGFDRFNPILELTLTKAKDYDYCLRIGDNGPGFKVQEDIKKLNSLGLNLIHRLAVQINGKIERDLTRKGVHYIIKFND